MASGWLGANNWQLGPSVSSYNQPRPLVSYKVFRGKEKQLSADLASLRNDQGFKLDLFFFQ